MTTSMWEITSFSKHAFVVIPKRNLIIMTMRGFDVLFQKEIEMRENERSEKKRWGGGGPGRPFY